MSSSYSLYQLGAYETLWKDDCSACPEHIEFQNATNCDRQSVVNSTCYRGDWAEKNVWFGYHFQFPPEWSTGAVEYKYSFRFWALGSWENGKTDQESGGSSYCEPSVAFVSDEKSCGDQMSETRDSQTECKNWDEWEADGGSFDPYTQWNASGGDDGNAKTACFKDKSYTRSTEESSITVGFWTWQNTYGISGPRANEAWVVSDFEIEFTPPEFTTLKPDTTKTTAVKTSTTDAPTTASELQTTVETKDATTKTSEAVTDTATGKPLNTTTSVDIVETTNPTTTEGTKDGKGGSGFLAGIVLYGVVGGALFCALFCFVSIWNWNRRKSAQPKDEECVSETQVERVRSLSEIRIDVSSKPSEIAEDHGADDKENVIVEKSEAAVELQPIGQLPADDIVKDASDSLQPVIAGVPVPGDAVICDMSQPCTGGVLPAAKPVVDAVETKKLSTELMADETPGRRGADEKKGGKAEATATHLLEDANEGVTTGDPLHADYGLKDAICDEEMDADKAHVTAGAPPPRRTRKTTREGPEGH